MSFRSSEASWAQFYVPVDSSKAGIGCVDDRSEGGAVLRLYGGSAALVDLIKRHGQFSEEDAWEMLHQAGIPLIIHDGPVHGTGVGEWLKKKTVYKFVGEPYGPRGCGYAALVEDNPSKVGAIEHIPASQRMSLVTQMGGSYYSVHGHHQIDAVLLNHRDGFTIDYDRVRGAGLGVLVTDVWAAKYYADRLRRVSKRLSVPQTVIQATIENNSKLVGNRLAPRLTAQTIY